ncbi:hypothetical protein Xen7305DRAFT_00009450 [Xenococcus sp. PCC 7305]|uniref:hypothetical protein n=1 Tax=Xenococcus sp. PCC 7305 TaxID=102125 RepID=UPI0002ACD659|nr:hypothetical protein [Xenococcus sp. PCC 7305]ELS01242.1 hypothetical protein Xen7305DRAFT_00009450 [Xenococcus sp. PCC 7305]
MSSQLIKDLASFKEEKFTGVVTITSLRNRQWKVYFYLGMLLWVEGGSHTFRFWQRHFQAICSEATMKYFDQNNIYSQYSCDYHFIEILLKNQLARRESITSLIEQRVRESFFDILQEKYVQQEHRASLKISSQNISAHVLLKSGFHLSLSSLETLDVLSTAEKDWGIWLGKGLASCSPNRAPVLKDYEELKAQVPSIIFQNMVRLLDGEHTLRDLAIKMNKSVFEVTCGLIPYFFKGYIKLVEIPDLPGLLIPT